VIFALFATGKMSQACLLPESDELECEREREKEKEREIWRRVGNFICTH